MRNPIKPFPGYLLRVVSQKLMAELSDKLMNLDIRITEGTILLLIQSNPGIRQTRIGDELNIARANMAPLIAKLGEKGFVTKEAIDGRSYGLHLTADGKSTARQVFEIMSSHEDYIMQTIPQKSRESFMSALRSLQFAPAQEELKTRANAG